MIAHLRSQTCRRDTLECGAGLAFEALDLRPAHQQAFHTERMEQLRHRLTNVSRNGQTCRADQNPLKRGDLDDFVACYNPKNRHERKESERFKSFTYEELTKRDP